MGKGDDLDPEEWCWLRVRNRLEPIMTDLPTTSTRGSRQMYMQTRLRHTKVLLQETRTGLSAELRVVKSTASSAARTRRYCQQRSLTTLTKRVASLKLCSMRSCVHFHCTWMLSVLAYMPNVISSEFVIGYDGEFANKDQNICIIYIGEVDFVEGDETAASTTSISASSLACTTLHPFWHNLSEINFIKAFLFVVVFKNWSFVPVNNRSALTSTILGISFRLRRWYVLLLVDGPSLPS